MKRNVQRITRRVRRKKGLRSRLMGSPDRPRLTVFRSAKHIYAQVIDDLSGKTLAAASTTEKETRGSGGNVAAATEVGKRIGARAAAAGVTAVVFDRNGFKYHGRVKGLADGAREGGLKF